jgi:hypothetical protein
MFGIVVCAHYRECKNDHHSTLRMNSSKTGNVNGMKDIMEYILRRDEDSSLKLKVAYGYDHGSVQYIEIYENGGEVISSLRRNTKAHHIYVLHLDRKILNPKSHYEIYSGCLDDILGLVSGEETTADFRDEMISHTSKGEDGCCAC